jgi:hypothetical protein
VERDGVMTDGSRAADVLLCWKVQIYICPQSCSN